MPAPGWGRDALVPCPVIEEHLVPDGTATAWCHPSLQVSEGYAE